MGDRTGRLAAVFGALVALWIVVYWAWTPGDDPVRVTFADSAENPARDTPPAADGAGSSSTGVSSRADARSPRRTPAEADQQPEPVEIAQEPTPTPPTPPTGAEPVIEPESGVRRPEFVDYMVREGDTLERIARDRLGDGALWTAIARANPLKDPNRIKPGDMIRIPVDPTNIQGTPTNPTSSPTTPTSSPTDTEADEDDGQATTPVRTVEYTVKTGDTLGGISFAFYGSARHAEFIFNANRDVLASMDRLTVGQVLQIPPSPGGE